MMREQRQAMIDRNHQHLSLVRQCTLLGVSRASVYYRPGFVAFCRGGAPCLREGDVPSRERRMVLPGPRMGMKTHR